MVLCEDVCSWTSDPDPRFPKLPKAALNVVVAEEQALDGPEVLPHVTVAQIGLYAHRGLDGRSLQRVAVTLTHARHAYASG